jgi:outer membrane receptor protein involved in Fe transport
LRFWNQFQFGNNRYHSRMSEFGFFVQDDWRVTPNLVINLGIRYDSCGHYVGIAA